MTSLHRILRSILVPSVWCVLACSAPDDDCVRISGDLVGADVERCASRVEHVAGSLWLNDANGELELPRLIEVGGDVQVLEDGPSVLVLPRLKRIGGNLGLSSPELESVALPVLESAAEVSISSCPVLRSVSLPALRELRSGLEVVDPQFEELNLPNLARVGTGEFGAVEVARIAFDQPPKLHRLLMPKLQRVDVLTIENNGELEDIDLGSLTTVTTSLALLGDSTSERDSLERLELPALQEVNLLWVQLTYNLTRVSLPALRAAQQLWFTDNEALSEVEVRPSARVLDVDARGNPTWCGLDELLEALELECSDCDAKPAACDS